MITFDYGQKHKKEIEYAGLLADDLNTPHQVVDISNIQNLLGGSALTDDNIEVPEGHYAAENMAITVVPNRNAIFLTVACFLKLSRVRQHEHLQASQYKLSVAEAVHCRAIC